MGKLRGTDIRPGKIWINKFQWKHWDKGNNSSIFTDNFTITVNQRNLYLKWLGIHFDRKLTFRKNVHVQASKALKVTNVLRSLGNTVQGVSPRLSRKVIKSCILPIAHFGTPTWWPGKTREKGDQIISNRVGSHLDILDKVHKACARVILPAYRATPTSVPFRESGLGPA